MNFNINTKDIKIPGYTIIRKIGEGGMSVVYLAIQDSLKREVALKVLRPRIIDDPEVTKRFIHEAETIAKLYHPNIVSIYEVGSLSDDVFYYSMPFLEHGDLTEFNYSNDRQLIRLLHDLCDGLNYAHNHGVVHRDIKPENILFDKFGNVQIADFGIALSEGEQRWTKENHILGSVYYMSPEQAKARHVDARSDIYSLGAILFELLAGRVPYKESDDLSTLMAHVSEPVPELPADKRYWQPFINKCLAKSPGRRFQNVLEVKQALRKVPQYAITQKFSNLKTNISLWYKHHKRLIGLIGALALTLIVVGGLVWLEYLRRHPELALSETAIAAAPDESTEAGLDDGLNPDEPVVGNGNEAEQPEVQTQRTDLIFTEMDSRAQRPQETVPEPLSPIEQSKVDLAMAQVELLLDEAEARVQSRQLTLPADDNALDRYLTVLKSFPDNERARRGLLDVVKVYYGFIERKVNAGEYAEAGTYIDAAQTVLDRSPLDATDVREASEALLLLFVERAQVERGRYHRDRVTELLELAQRLNEQSVSTRELLGIRNALPKAGAVLSRDQGVRAVFIPARMDGVSSRYRGNGFAVTAHEITRAQYQAFVVDTGREAARCRDALASGFSFSSKTWDKGYFYQQDNHPVICVSWLDARAYARWLSEKSGHAYRLPSAAEWQHLAALYQSGSGLSVCQLGNVAGAEAAESLGDEAPANCRDADQYTASVGSYPANMAGVFDLVGNVQEWTTACAPKGAFRSFIDKLREDDGLCDRYTAFGSAWASGAEKLKAPLAETFEHYKNDDAYSHVGFRLVRNLSAEQ